MNDRPDIANLTDCAGVHIGPEDLSYEETRSIVGADAIVGVSCKDSVNYAVNMAKKVLIMLHLGLSMNHQPKKLKLK